MITRAGKKPELLRQNLQRIISEARLEAEAEVLVLGEQDGSPVDLIRGHSRGDLVLLGLRPPDPEEGAAEFVARINELVDRLPTCVLVKSNSDFEGAEMLFEKEYRAKRRPVLRVAPLPEAEDSDLETAPHALEGQALDVGEDGTVASGEKPGAAADEDPRRTPDPDAG